MRRYSTEQLDATHPRLRAYCDVDDVPRPGPESGQPVERGDHRAAEVQDFVGHGPAPLAVAAVVQGDRCCRERAEELER